MSGCCQAGLRVVQPAQAEIVKLASHTGPMPWLRGKEVLTVADVQNLAQSARDLGMTLLWQKLGWGLARAAERSSRHAVFAAHGRCDLQRRSKQFFQWGWIPHARMARRSNGQRDANADHTLCCVVASLVERFNFDLIVLATGDGPLALHVADFVRRLVLPRKRTPVVTLSLPGKSFSGALWAHRTCLIHRNMFIGRDCLKPLAARREATELRIVG